MAKTFEKATLLNFRKMIDYSDGGVVSKQIMKNEAGNITLFSFDQGEGLSEHSTPYDALVEVIEGRVEITIGGEKHTVSEGESIIMPATIPHALHGVERFKMLLTMIKG
ncbi:cupin domain-containing protein [Chryseobacterium suipulveris]|uniref:Cupin domain-containing protein n=1 Tax=Chryseobacterium suipulveris TaxID=2929800 RepID=A0ABY4BT01_9FLAO|nr:cupin domain-containing protein [Chryseobacterium suipulveris]UOE42319.1 cupin domain-containing protein [Chryseobacterium suipulveris]